MKGVYSIAEIMESVHDTRKITIVHIIPDGFDEAQLRSLMAVRSSIQRHGGIAYIDSELARSARVLNYCFS